MRILYFSRSYTPHDHRFLAAMSDEGYEVYFLQLESQAKVLEERKLPAGVKLLFWEVAGKKVTFFSLPKYIREFRAILEDIKPDIVHAGPIQTAGIIAAMSGFRPLVSMSWAYDLLFDAKKGNFNNTATKYTLKNSDRMIADCDTIADLAIKYGMDPEKIVKFPWGVDLDKFSLGRNTKLRKELGWEDEIILLHLRSWETIYGVDVLIKGFIKAVKQEPRLRLLMLGGGSLEWKIKKLLTKEGFMDKVNFAGQIKNEELPEYYKAADLYLSASHSDGSSVSLMEALACGLPAILSDIPGNKEWIQNDEQGWLFKDGSVKALVNSIIEASNKYDDLGSYGKKARATAEERANWKENSRILIEAYEQLYRNANE